MSDYDDRVEEVKAEIMVELERWMLDNLITLDMAGKVSASLHLRKMITKLVGSRLGVDPSWVKLINPRWEGVNFVWEGYQIVVPPGWLDDQDGEIYL